MFDAVFNSLIISKPGEEIRLKKEEEKGNIEYKFKLDEKTEYTKKKMVSQLNRRLDSSVMSGRKEVHYILGICDDGTFGKRTEPEIDVTFDIFNEVIKMAKVDVTYVSKKQFGNYFLIHAVVQKIENFKIKEINIAFVGASQHGKTTTISHLVYGQHDDGIGYSRKLIFKHEHEKVSGITSSVKKEIIGLSNGNLVNYSVGISTGWQDIVEMSNKVVNLIDLPGNLKYFRSTFYGLSTYSLDGIIIVIDPKKINEENDINEFIFYRLFAETFNIPYTFLVVNDSQTKYDNEIINNNLIITSQKYIEFSNLNCYGFNEMVKFFDSLDSKSYQANVYTNVLFFVMETYCVPDVGTIFSGILKSGQISIGDELFITNGQTYYQTKVRSIQRKQIDSRTLYISETGAIQVEFDTTTVPEVNKHMIITSTKLSTYDTFIFESLNQSQDKTILKSGQKCVMFVDNIITNVFIKITHIVHENFPQTDQKIELKTDRAIIVPSLGNECVAFLKCDTGVLFGKLSVITH
jgi:GTPase